MPCVRRPLMLVVVLMVAVQQGTVWGQKVEMDGLEDDTYHMHEMEYTGTDNGGRHAKNPPVSSKDLKYVVTDEVYFDIFINNRTEDEKPHQSRVKIGCFGELTPITCLNFVALAKGYRKGRELLTYKNTPVHRIVRDFVIQMGDVTGKRGKSGKSIYGETFEDENFILSHRGAGWVSMANHGKDTNGSQFFILLQPARWLDGRHVVFAKVIKGMDTIYKLAELETWATGRPKVTVDVVESGTTGVPKYEIPHDTVMLSADL